MSDAPLVVTFVNAEVLRVAADEVLVIKIPPDYWEDRPVSEIIAEHLASVGLTGRCLVIAADDVELVVVKREQSA